MDQCTNNTAIDNEINQQIAPLFTARDTVIGLVACLGVGIIASLALSAIILLLSANAQADGNLASSVTVSISKKTMTRTTTNRPNIIDYSTPESLISQKCDAQDGQLKNISIGDNLVFQNEGSIKQLFRITGIQVIEETPEFLPVIDSASMLTIITCYPTAAEKSDLAISYLVMIEDIASEKGTPTPYQHVFEQNFEQNIKASIVKVSQNSQSLFNYSTD